MNDKIKSKLRQEQIAILDEIDRICKKNNINYFIFYGTLLGSIRHKGYIPWDDDIDICMLRKDYEKFVQIATNELSNPYILDWYTTNQNYYLPFAKVRNNNTIMKEKNIINYKGSLGIWVDIFPMDYLKDKESGKKLYFRFRLLNILYMALLTKNNGDNYSWKINIVSKLLSNKMIFKFINNLSKSKKENNEVLFYNTTGYNTKSIISYDEIFPLKEYTFEDKKYYGPNNYKSILNKLYGDNFMELPPEDKRINHNPVFIKFSDGEKCYFKK